VETVDDVYHQANASIIPIRLGGGTRIKALEAFDRSCPVISTCQGVYGLDVEHNKHLLVADETTEFARACCKILTDDKLVTELTTHAFQFVKEYYTIERLTEILKRCG
jgi:glycosyltransferase involved in cell wall biosynthesis